MKVLARYDRERGIKLILETIDDLWHLHLLLKEGDEAKALTSRREEQKADKLRSSRGDKVKMVLGIEVQKVEFHPFSDRLRVHGTIKTGPRDLGSFHTLNLGLGDNVTIYKQEWARHELQRIRDAEEATKRPLVTICAIDDDDATIGQLRQYGVQQSATVPSGLSGKQYSSSKDDKKRYFTEVVDALVNVHKPDSPLFIIGPGFLKEELTTFGKQKDPEVFRKTYVKATGSAGMAGIQEALKGGFITSAVAEQRVEQETTLVEQLFAEISKSGMASYGEKEVNENLAAGAVQTLLVSDSLLKQSKADALLKTAEASGAKTMIISSLHEAGQKLDAIGGVAALLRYKMR